MAGLHILRTRWHFRNDNDHDSKDHNTKDHNSKDHDSKDNDSKDHDNENDNFKYMSRYWQLVSYLHAKKKTFLIYISFQGLVQRPQVASLSLWYCEKQINSIFLENGLEMLEKYFDISVIEIFFRAPVHRWLVWASSIVRADYNVSCRATAARTSCTDPSYVEKSNHKKKYNGKNE